MNYEEDLLIDPTALDVEWLNQPHLMATYSRELARVELEVDTAKEKVDFVKAELDKEIRTDPESFDLAKATETAITNAILMQKKYKIAMEAYLQAKFEAKVVSGIVKSFDHRKSALENLVKLHGQNYFAGPSVPRDLSREWEVIEKQKSSDAKVKIKRTKRD